MDALGLNRGYQNNFEPDPDFSKTLPAVSEYPSFSQKTQTSGWHRGTQR